VITVGAGTPQVTPYFYPSGFTAPAASPGAALFNGSTDNLSAASNPAFGFGTDDFTIDLWVYVTNTSNAMSLVDLRNGVETTTNPLLYMAIGGGISWLISGVVRIASAAITANSWVHIAVSRSSASTKLYINGTQAGSTYSDINNYTQSSAFIGRGSVTTTLYVNGYISNVRLVKGTAVYTGNFTPPTLAFLQTSGAASAASYASTTNVNTTFPASNTSLLLNLADSNYLSATNGVQNNTFIDSSNYAFPITRNGTPTQGSITPYWPNGQWSNYFVAVNTIYNASISSMNFGASTDFTIEAWVNWPAAAGANQTFFELTGTTRMIFGRTTTGFRAYWNGTEKGSAYTFALGTWYHIAVVRNSGTVSFYINGSLLTSFADTVTWTGISRFNIGSNSNDFEPMTGYISNLRVVNGTAVYTSAFTPPTSPLTAITNTQLLTCQSNRFQDNSTNNYTLSFVGTPRVQAFQPFSPTASYTTALYGGSGLFNGGTDYLQTPSNSAVSAWSTDFTIESYIYLTSLPATTSWWTNSTSNSDGFTLCYIKTDGSIALGRVGVNESASAAGVIKLNQWQHIAVVRNSSIVTLYVNGVSVATPTTANLETATTKPLTIGGQFQSSGNSNFNGFISNFRVVKGTAVYTGNFTPPTLAPLATTGPASAASYSSTTNVNTTFLTPASLLLNMTNAGIYDAAVQNDVTTVGDAQASSTITAQWPPTSMKFDGTGDWLTAIDNPQLQLGTGDFTIEGWFYLTANGTAYGIVSKGAASTGWSVNVTSGNRIQFSYTAANLTGSTTTLAASTWYYFAVVRSGSATGNLKIYINGALEVTSGGAVTDNFNQTNILYVGASRTGTTPLNGYLEDIRITKAARTITASPTAAFPTR
jgi:hypothetical protein